MNYKKLVFCCILFTSGFISEVFNQIPSKIWYFGKQAGLDFKTDPPTPLYNQNLNNQESNATLTDSAGNLLFYVTADKIYNKQHLIMENGDGLICNGGSSAQGPMILQDPADPMKYYIFMTADETFPEYRGNLRYIVVNLCENNGLGKVIPGLKNVQIPGFFSERITAISLHQGQAYWIITSSHFENTIVSFYFDSRGIDINNPVFSYFGREFSPQVGQIKVNHKKTQILYSAGLDRFGNGVWLMDYDTIRGVASNRLEINSGTHDYGIEFSPDDQLVYYTSFYVISGVYQYQLSTGNKTILFQNNSNYYVASINKDPHGRLIVSSGVKNIVSAILNPNIVGVQCNYQESYIQLLPNTSGHFGMQNTEQYFGNQQIIINQQFLGNDTLICDDNSLRLTTNYSNTIWSTGQTGSQISISRSGTYWASFERDCKTYTDTIKIDFINPPDLISKTKISLCEGESDTLSTFQDVIWSDGSFDKQIIINKAGIYWAKLNTPCGDVIDSVVVDIIKKLDPPEALRDTSFCKGQTINYSIQIKNAQWNTGAFEIIHINSSGFFSYLIENGCEEISDAFQIHIDSMPILLPIMITSCEGETITLNSGDPRSLWNTGHIGSQIQVKKSGIYNYSLQNACGTFNSSVDVYFEVVFTANNMPNVFSPNGDQINDEFPGREFKEPFHIRIFSRWGELLFEGRNQSWDGRFHSRPMPPDTYVYVIEVEACHQKQKLKGSATLLR
ncbi:MAG: gliding motility-associated C-terminal domain-containing protein [Saprospiraceae bacterium]|nr:gliding motility-associated C-terminal domain-containing protein [Saprospiraceae bacterium]